MFDFTVVEKRETDLAEWLYDYGYGMQNIGELVSDIEDYAPRDLSEAFVEAIEDIFDFDLYYDEIDSEDLYNICVSDDFRKLVERISEVAKKLYDMEDYTCTDLIKFLCNFDPFDPPFDDAKGKIDFYIQITDQFLNDPNELIKNLKTMREDIDGETDEAEAIDDFIKKIEDTIIGNEEER